MLLEMLLMKMGKIPAKGEMATVAPMLSQLPLMAPQVANMIDGEPLYQAAIRATYAEAKKIMGD